MSHKKIGKIIELFYMQKENIAQLISSVFYLLDDKR